MDEQQSSWAIVELFGHKTLAGRVTKDTSLFPLLRIDVPATEAAPEFTAEYGPGAIYGITYVSEEVARLTAQAVKATPIAVYSPQLVTREAFEKMQDQYRKRIEEMRALPERSGGNLRPIERDDLEYSDDDEDEGAA